MRRLLAAVATLLCVTCTPNHDAPTPGVPDPVPPSPIPVPENVSTQIAGIVTDASDNFFTNAFVFKGQDWPIGNAGSFITNRLTTDKYISRLSLNDPLNVEKRKILPLTEAELNYVRVKAIKIETLGTFKNTTGGSYTFAGTGNLSIPSMAVFQTASPVYPGYYDASIQTVIGVGYLDPLSPDFGVSIPCYSMVDDNNQRSFLASLGVVAIGSGYMNPISDRIEYDLYSTYQATLKVPIPAQLVAAAPDTITLWRLNYDRWVRAGVAQKSGAAYTTTIRSLAVYNLAAKVKGVYKTIRLRTDNGTPIIAAAVKVKLNQAVVAEAMTDWDGNAVVYVPADVALTVEVYQNLGNPDVAHTASISSVGTVATIDVAVAASSARVYQFKGNAYSCDGSTIQKGRIVLYNRTRSTTYYLPVNNGTYSAAIISDLGSNYIITAKAINNLNNEEGADTSVVPKSGIVNNYNLNNCKLSQALFMKYKIDGVETVISVSMASPHNPALNAYRNSNNTLISTQQGTKGLQFSTNAFDIGNYTGSGIADLFVNEVSYFYDVNKPMRVTFTRYDLLAPGFVIGTADFYYKDGGGVSHHVEAEFKLNLN